MRWFLPFVVGAGCAAPGDFSARDAFVIDTLATDNFMWAQREPELVRQKLVLMQQQAYTWLRGTAAVYWREAMAPGARPGTGEAQRVLLVGDPHPENLGTFLAADGTIALDWNDFDTAGWGPIELDVRRLAIGMVIATGNRACAHAVGEGYAGGAMPDSAYLAKLVKNAAKADPVGDFAPGGLVAFGDRKPVDADGVIQDRLLPVGQVAHGWIAQAIAAWSGGARTVALEARQLGKGVSSFPALRYAVLLDDGTLIELKEERDGAIVTGVPHDDAAVWDSPGERAVAAQRALQERPDLDTSLGSAKVGALSMKIRGLAAAKGVAAEDLAQLDAGEQLAIATRFGAMLAISHARGGSEDGSPVEQSLDVDAMAAAALAGVDELMADFDHLSQIDLAPLVLR